MKNTSQNWLFSRIACCFTFSTIGLGICAQPIQFEYALKITADPVKRAAAPKAVW